MSGTIFGAENGTAITILALCFVLFTLFIITFVFWRREVNERKRQSKELLESTKRTFSGEIHVTINSLVKIIKTILPEFERGRYSIILKNAISNSSEKFSESASSLCDCLNTLSAEIDRLKAKEEAVAVRAIAERIREMKLLVDNYSVRSIQEAIRYNSKKNDLIRQLEIALRKLQELVENRHSEPKDEMSSEE